MIIQIKTNHLKILNSLVVISAADGDGVNDEVGCGDDEEGRQQFPSYCQTPRLLLGGCTTSP